MDYIKAERQIIQIIKSTGKKDIIQRIVDFLYENFEKYSWVGIYIVKKDDLVLGPWRGKQATEHTKIPIGKGVCGSAADIGKTEIVSNVNSDSRYLACFASTRSEIVVPIKNNSQVIGEIDIDSDFQDAFKEEDKLFLGRIADKISCFIEKYK